MDVNSRSNLGESSQSSTLSYICDSLAVDVLSANCALCHRILSPDIENGDIEAISICGDCKFLLMEDLETASPRRMPLSRTRYDSSESIQNMFSQQLSQMISLARQNHENQSVDGDAAARLVQRTSSRTTPSGSRRWRRVLSDTESDGGESESNISYRRYRLFHGDTDTVSFSAYGGESDASVDGHSFLENENFAHPNGESELESDVGSDTDIDPMNAGLYHWNSEDDEYSEWEADVEGSTLESLRAGVEVHGSSRLNGSNVYINWRRRPQVEGVFPMRTRERIQAHAGDLLGNFEESDALNYVGDSGDYLDARGFESLLEHLAETESSRRGAPPASVSFINNIPSLTIDEDKVGMPCAVCKDSFTAGIVVNELPCFHVYHPSCILPWLSARNTCPLCRYELPTDDKDYEARKRNGRNEYQTFDIQQHDVNDDSSLDATTYDALVEETSPLPNGREQREDGSRNRWFFLAAPIVSMVGISLLLWFGRPSSDRRCRSGHIPSRRETTQRRWWSFF